MVFYFYFYFFIVSMGDGNKKRLLLRRELLNHYRLLSNLVDGVLAYQA